MIVGLDIGGANLKASDGSDRSASRPFAIWKHPDRLTAELCELLDPFGAWTALAVTMTAELADCFPNKAEGVERILEAVRSAAQGRPVHVWQTGGEFVSIEEAAELPRLVAAANWHALATWAGRMVPRGSGLLIDIGSTTTDIIPIESGIPLPEGRTDVERLLSGELVYTGVRRTPVCAVAATVPLREQQCPLAAELFATTRDVYLVTGDLPEQPDDTDTADGRPATKAAALGRLAHQLCCDTTELTESELTNVAASLARQQTERITIAVQRVVDRLEGPCEALLACGEGEFLIDRVWAAAAPNSMAEIVRLSQALGPVHSQAACAFSLARLAAERA